MGFEDYKPIIVMIGCQFIYAGMTLSVRAALLEEMSSSVLVVYRQSVAFLLIAPVAFISRYKKERNKWLSFELESFWLIFLLSFIGVTADQNAINEGLSLVPSPVATAMSNLIPAITFIMAYTLGLEKVHRRSLRGIAKIVGTVVCVTGAAAITLFKGPKLLNMEFLQTNSIFLQSVGGYDQTWLIGCLFLFGGAFCWSLWLILQVHVNACYPDLVSSTAWICLIAALQSAMLTLIIEPNMNAWKLSSPLQIFACCYSGMTSAVTFFAQAWCVARRGPLFSAMFMPLCTVIVTVLGCIFMHEELYTGSLIGGLAVIIGLYIVLWGKAKDNEEVMEETTPYIQVSDDTTSCSIDFGDPFLPEKPAN